MTTSASKKSARKLPAPLAKRVAEEVAAKKERLATSAREDIDLIKRRRADVSEGFFEIGLALQRLKDAKKVRELGYTTYAEMLRAELDLSVTKADRLIEMVTRAPRSMVVRLGQDRTAALMALADATPEDDSPETLENATLKLPSGEKLRVAKASTLALFEAAKAIRAKHAHARRGRTTSPEERARGAGIERALRAAGIPTAKVEVLATKPGKGADVRLRVPLDEVGRMAKAVLAASAKRR